MMYQKYDAYKDSGVQWLGDIPNDWKTYKIKNLCVLISNKTTEKTNVISLENIESWTGKLITTESKFEGDAVKFKINDILFGKLRPYLAKVYLAKFDGEAFGDIYVFRHNTKVFPDFFKYFFLSNTIINIIDSSTYGTKMPRANWDFIGGLRVTIPVIHQQEKIASFLDQKTTQIDQAIATKEQQIALLNERKQIVIQQAVTKGLDPNVKMKDSGVDWIGEIPEHWQLSKLRYLGVTQNGISAGSEYFGSGYPFVSYGDVYKNRQLPLSVDGLAKSSIADQKNYSVLEGDVFFTRTSETVDEIGFASICYQTIEKATFAGFLIRFRPTNANYITKEFSKYYFNAQMMRTYFVKEMNLVIRASLSQELLKNLIVLLPSIDEQKAIASYLDRQMDAINELIGLQMSAIQKLKEYKTTLINDAVTGKIKVA